MKFRNKILAASLASLLSLGCLTSCDYLDIDPEDSVPEESVDYTDLSNMYAPVSGVYGKLRTGGTHWVINMMTVIRDGDVWSGRVDDQGDLVNIGRNFTYGSFWGIKEMWNQYYGIIKTANAALESLEGYAANITDQTTMAKNLSYQGEVRIIRAYAYYRLAQEFGAVTILRSNDQTDMRRSTRDAVLRYALEDLEFAISNCETVHPKNAEHTGAYTSYTAAALAAKAYLILGDYANVERTTSYIINSNKFDLYSDYYQLFKTPGQLCEESLMEVQATDFGMGSGDQVTVDCFFIACGPGLSNSELNTSIGGWNFVGYEDSFQQWAAARGETVRTETSFLRADTTTPSGDYVQRNGNAQNTDCWNGKWYLPIDQLTPGRTDYGGANNVRIIRYAEVLLMNAEALVRQGKSGDAPFNKVRTRAQMPTLSGVTVDQILDERRMELCCEWGTRYEDLMRTGQAASVLPNWTADKAYYPVPTDHEADYPELREDPIE
jgi:hypothetical protein